MNRIIPLAVATVIFVFVGVALLQNNVKTYSVKVDLPPTKAMEYFTDSTRMNQWMVPFRNAAYKNDRMISGTDTLTILKYGAFKIDFNRSTANGSQDFSITVFPDKDSTNQAHFVLEYHTPRWRSFSGYTLTEEAEASLDSLRKYMDDPKRLYGFEIKGEPVVDTSFLFARKEIETKDFAAETKALYDMLITEANKRNAGYNGVRIFHFINNGSKRSIFASIGITKNIETKETDPVSFKQMPFNGKLLTLDYTGPYKDITRAYKALEDFKADNGYVSMAIPFHKYLDPGYGFSDTTVVHMKVCYPVF